MEVLVSKYLCNCLVEAQKKHSFKMARNIKRQYFSWILDIQMLWTCPSLRRHDFFQKWLVYFFWHLINKIQTSMKQYFLINCKIVEHIYRVMKRKQAASYYYKRLKSKNLALGHFSCYYSAVFFNQYVYFVLISFKWSSRNWCIFNIENAGTKIM